MAELGEAFAQASHDLYLVGGSVRDALMGRLGHDLDFTTDARPDDTEAILRQHTHATWDIGRAFGTIGAQIDDWVVEVTTYRADAYHPDSRTTLFAATSLSMRWPFMPLPEPSRILTQA